MNWKRVECLGEGLSGFGRQFFEEGWMLRQNVANAQTYPAIVPGDVRLALLRAGVIPDPFIGQNNDASKWIADVAWDYENALELGPWATKILQAFKNGGILHVVFDAIDYDASFYAGGQKVCRQVGMFSPVNLASGITPDVKGLDEKLPIRVHFHVQPWWRQHAVKCQMAFGWDFAPELRTVGIWKNVRVHFTGPAFFSEVYPAATNGKVTLKGVVKILDPSTLAEVPDKQELAFQVALDGLSREVSITVQSGVPFEISLGSADIPLWEPWSVGTPAQVSITIRLLWQGTASDEYRGQVVNRQVRWARNPGTRRGNENWTLEVNGKRMFLRGINWVPPDSIFGRIDEARYEKLIKVARDLQIDMFRVWGGGIEEKTAFYDLCDKAGMMVWQEFPFACTNYPRDPRYMAIARRECEGMVQRTRRHPAVVTYCGGNEFNPFINAHIVSMCKDAVGRHAPDRHCFAVSPFAGDDHNWKVWGARRMFEAYDIAGKGPFQMLTEFGMQAVPDLATMAEFLPGKNLQDLSTIAEDLKYHKADLNGFHVYALKTGRSFADLSSLMHFTQSLQAYAYKYAIETCRANWPNVSGVFPWQFSDPWPNVSWSVLDYKYHPKLAYKMMEMVYAPVLPLIRYQQSSSGKNWQQARIIVHNSTQVSFLGTLYLEVGQAIFTPNGTRQAHSLYSEQWPLKVSPERSLAAGFLDVPSTPGTVIRMRLTDPGDHVIARNFSYPVMEPLQSTLQHLKDRVNVRFDAWWRKYMVKLMEIDRLRTEAKEWQRKKAERGTISK